MRTPLCLVCATILVPAISAQISVVTDINAQAFSNPASEPEWVTGAGGWIYFTVRNQRTTGAELYRALQLAPVFQLVKDIRPGPQGSSPTAFAAIGAGIWFAADDGVHGSEPWISDGTAAGTYMVADLVPGPGSSQPGGFSELAGTVLFSANGPGLGRELYRSDGTAGGTILLADIAPGAASSTPAQFTRFGNALFFQAFDPVHGIELWRTDGTAAGTALVKDLWPGTGLNFGNAQPTDFTVMAGVLYFIATTATGSTELWRSDGTTAGTTQVRAFPQALVFPNRLPARILGVHAGLLWLAANDGSGQELFTSDGTAAGTVLVADIDPQGSSQPASLVPLGSHVLFVAGVGLVRGVWRSDGTAAGTVQVRSFPSAAGPRNLSPAAGAVLFSAQDPVHGEELWSSDGTLAGTYLVKDIQPGSASSSLNWWHTEPGIGVFFSANDGAHGAELWTSDGTPAGTVLVADVEGPLPGTGSAMVEAMTSARGRVLFRATDGVNGTEPWSSDGTANGTRMLKDIMPGNVQSSGASGFAMLGGTLFFGADEGIGIGRSGAQVWRSDGTSNGTARVTNLMPSHFGLNPINLTVFRHEAWFFGDVSGGHALYRTDGTTTVEVARFLGRGASPALNRPVAVGDTLFFAAYDPLAGHELWKTDGTQAGTVLVKDLWPGTMSSSPMYLHAWRGQLWFAAYNISNDHFLWRSDGTAAGTVLVANVRYPQAFCTVGDTLFIASAQDGLWRSDGTPAGTVPLGASLLDGRLWLENLGDRLLLFAGYDPARGCELWRSDGTVAGTQIVRDLFPGADLGLESRPRATGSRFAFFTGTDGATGRELWVTDGTPAGTRLVQDLVAGAGDSLPANDGLTMTLCRGRLLLGAMQPGLGEELHILDPGASAQTVGDACGTGRRTPHLAATDPVLGLSMTLDGREAPAPAVAVVLAGVPDPRAAWFGDDCYSTLDLGQTVLVLAVLPLAQPRWTAPVPIPNDGGLVGVHLAVQTWFVASPSSPRGFELSNGILATLGR